MIIDDVKDFNIEISSFPTLSWAKTDAEIGITAESPPVFCDVNGDGVKEIFWAGKPYNDLESAYAHLVCIDGTDGHVIWDKPYLQYWGAGNPMRHLPVMVYDFDKDGNYEVIAAGASICRDAITGNIKWQKPTNYFGWHHNAFIDFGTHVTLYTCGGGYLRRINGATGDIIGIQQQIIYTCWGGVSIAKLNPAVSNEWDIILTSRGWSPYKGLQLYSEDLSVMRWNKMFTCSSHPAKLYDVDGDGQEEIIAGKQAGSNSKIYIVKRDGTLRTIGPLPGLEIHTEPTVGDCDRDGHMEWISQDNNDPAIVDLVTDALKFIVPHHSGKSPDIASVLSSSGADIIVTGATGTWIYRYDGQNYINKGQIFSGTWDYTMFFSVTGDIDGDGYNDLLIAGSAGMQSWKTTVPTPNPEQINLIAFGGMKRLNNNKYYPIPGTE